MQVVILAGGFGTRFAEETDHIPKPMIRIGGIPILIHIMQTYSFFGHKEFMISTGYLSEYIESYFYDHRSHIRKLGWSVEIVNTGVESGTLGRISRLQDRLMEEFLCTYGDGVSTVDLGELLKFHHTVKPQVTLTAVRPPARFGSLKLNGNLVVDFQEKSPQREGWINGGFFVMNRDSLLNTINSGASLEGSLLTQLAKQGELGCYRHEAFWHPMDTLRDKRELENLLTNDNAPWIRQPGTLDMFRGI